MKYTVPINLPPGATALARKLKISQPAVSISVRRGEKVAKAKEFGLWEE